MIRKLARRAASSYADVLYVTFWQAAGLVNQHSSRRFERPHRSKGVAVVIIPGVYEAWHFVERLAGVLYRQGYPVYLIKELGYNNSAIPLSALAVRGFVNGIDDPEVVIIGHSKGGLIGKYLLVHHNKDGKVRRLIAVNTPFSGSLYALLLPLRSMRVFTPRSSVIRELQASTAVNTQITSIYSSYDPFIPASSRLENAENIEIETTGHFKILGESKLHAVILELMRRPS